MVNKMGCKGPRMSFEKETEELLSQDIDNCIIEDSKKQSQHSQHSFTDSQQNSQSLLSDLRQKAMLDCI